MAEQEVPAYVLVHGFADDSRTWGRLVPCLTDAEVHAWDLPGHGTRGDSPTELLNRDAAVTELTERIEALGSPVTLVGHSLGGYLALMVTIERPDLVFSLGLISSGPGFRRVEARTQWNAYMDSIAADRGMSAAVTALGYQPDSYVIDNITAVRSPLVHVLGSRDRRYRAGAEYLRSALPDSALVVIEGAGHHPQRSHPEQVAEALKSGRSAAAGA
jgi:pimeloyl-ACP methyl ester carboxylesterase